MRIGHLLIWCDALCVREGVTNDRRMVGSDGRQAPSLQIRVAEDRAVLTGREGAQGDGRGLQTRRLILQPMIGSVRGSMRG